MLRKFTDPSRSTATPTVSPRPRYNWLLAAAALPLAVLWLAHPARAVSDAENLSRFNVQAMSMYRTASESHRELDRIEREIDDFAQARSGGPDVAGKIEKALIEAGLKVDNFSRVIELQYPLPEFVDPSYAALASEIKASVQSIDELLGRQVTIGRQLLAAATSGDATAYANGSIRSLKLSTDFVVAESAMLRAALKLIPADDPGHGLTRGAVELNDAAITMWTMFAALHGATEPEENSPDMLVLEPLSRMADALDRAEEALVRSASALENPLGPLGEKSWVDRSDEVSQRFRADSIASISRSLEIEQNLLANYRRMRDLVLKRSQSPDSVDDAALARSFIGIVRANETLVDRRLDEAAVLQNLVGNYRLSAQPE